MSSIIQDKQLLNTLIKIANNKYAQTTPQPDPAKNTQILSQLVNNLRQNLDNYTEGDFTSEREDAELTLKNLQSDYQFLLFLQQNSILWENKPLAIVHSPGLPAERQKEQHFEIFKANRSINPKEYVKYPEPRDGRGDDFRFWINKEGVTEFLRSLYGKSKNERSGGKLLKVLLDKLLIAINNNSGQPIDPNSQPAPKLPADFSIDQFPQPYLLSKPFENRGPKLLTMQDISNPDEFKGWLANLKVNDKNNEEIPAPANKTYICLSLNAILERAENYRSQALKDPDAQKKQAYEYYYNQILSFVNANNCNVDQAQPGTGKGSGTDTEDKENTNERGSRNRGQEVVIEQNLDDLMAKLPLNTSTINFDNITEFFNYLVQVARPKHQVRFNKIKVYIDSYVTQYKALVKSYEMKERFNLNSSPDRIITSLGHPGNAYAAIEYLKRIVDLTREGIDDLKISLGDQIDPIYKSRLASQVGHSATQGNSIASENLEILSRLQTNVIALIDRTKGRR
jgi:hypothetical protein